MKLQDYKKKNKYSYRELAKLLGLERNKVYRLCTVDKYPVLLRDAISIESKTNKKVKVGDLL